MAIQNRILAIESNNHDVFFMWFDFTAFFFQLRDSKKFKVMSNTFTAFTQGPNTKLTSKFATKTFSVAKKTADHTQTSKFTHHAIIDLF